MKRFAIIDDDLSIIKMLSIIIENAHLGKISLTLTSGKDAVDEILFVNPDIILIDLLLPHIDGIEIIRQLKKRQFNGKCIMISQVSDPHMISSSYAEGSLFFINKPINPTEVLSVLKEVCRVIDLERSVTMIQNALRPLDPLESNAPQPSESSNKTKLTKIFEALGISNETGIQDLESIIFELLKSRPHSADYQLQSIYEHLWPKENIRTVEQRIRRLIFKAFQNLSEIGCDDYYHPIFQEYATILFDIKQLKIEMRRIEDSNKPKGKISIKKFIDGILSLLQKDN